jgi:hypothetical protein
MSMHRNGYPQNDCCVPPRLHDGESRRPPLTPNVVGFAPRGIGETLRGMEERWITI